MLRTHDHVKRTFAVSLSVLAWACARQDLTMMSDSGTGPDAPIGAGAVPSSDAELADKPDAASTGLADAPSDVVTQRCASSPIQLAPSPQVDGAIQFAMDLAVNGSDVVYAINGASATTNGTSVTINGASTYVYRVPIRGGSPVLLSTLDGAENAMLLTDTHAILSVRGAGDATAGSIVALALSGGGPTSLATTVGSPVASLASDGRDVYFADATGTKRVPLGGGSVETLAAQTGSLGIVGPRLLIASGDNLYELPADGGTAFLFATNQPGVTTPIACGQDVCWMTFVPAAPPGGISVTGNGLGMLMRATQAAAPNTLVASWSLPYPKQLVFDGSDFYVSQGVQQGRIVRIPGAGGFPVVLASASGELGLAVDDDCLYWGSATMGVFSVAKASAKALGTGPSNNPGAGTCVSGTSATTYCDQALSCAASDAGSLSCALGADGSPCGSFSCGAGCSCADAQANECSCVVP
jgi:hypothetical protein